MRLLVSRINGNKPPISLKCQGLWIENGGSVFLTSESDIVRVVIMEGRFYRNTTTYQAMIRTSSEEEEIEVS